ncbi:MAG: hypothetical protein SFW63_00820 [Alphaproteobacteria bacterium]|nr:hypothetical protein [Alphaproteobacteria bacterium]
MASLPRISAVLVSILLALAPVTASASPAAASADQRPLLLIRFNQEHVHYARPLRQAVANAENLRPGVVYRVVSVVPVSRRGVTPVPASKAIAQLKEVTAAMAELGVPAERIKTASENSKAVSSHEIRVFVE